MYHVLCDCVPQNAANADQSSEALLCHVISELSKDRSVFMESTEESSMVRETKMPV